MCCSHSFLAGSGVSDAVSAFSESSELIVSKMKAIWQRTFLFIKQEYSILDLANLTEQFRLKIDRIYCLAMSFRGSQVKFAVERPLSEL